jgi:exonuclease III
VRGLLNIQKEEDPDILFLSETKMDERRIDVFQWKLGMTNMMVKDCVGRSEGLAVFWKREVNVHVRMMSRFYIDADVTEVDGFVWRLTDFYGEPSSERKHLSWQALRVLNAARRHPWLCMGDFNEILLGCEKEGGATSAPGLHGPIQRGFGGVRAIRPRVYG